MKKTFYLAVALVLLPLTASSQPAPSPAAPSAQSANPAPAGGRGQRPVLPFEITRLDPALDGILAPDTKLDTIATIPGLSGEGPMWRNGKLWVSDQRGGNIYAVGLDGSVSVIAEKAGGPIDPSLRVNQGPNGEVSDKDGTVLICRQGLRDIGRLNKDGTFSNFLSGYQGKRFNSPNDLVFGADGTLWFTDPPFSVPGFSIAGAAGSPPADKQLPYNAVFRYKNGTLAPVVTDMNLPNGIGLSPDGRTLYVDNSIPDMYVRAYDVAPDGTLSNPRDLVRFDSSGGFARGVPDGMKVDSKGNVWVTGPGGINIVSPAGKILGRIQLPVSATNIAFGDDLYSVFFTSGSTIYRIRALVKGEEPLNYQK